MWRVWLAKGTPLDELKWRWTYEDLLKAGALLDMNETYDLGIDGLRED